MTKNNPHSIRNEPFSGARPEAGNSIREEPVFHAAPPITRSEERALHTVWDEPALRAGGVALPPDAYTYSRWYEEHRNQTSLGTSWATLLLLALCGGIFAVLATITSAFTSGAAGGLIYIVVVGPVVEEMMKIGAALMVLENRPYLYRSGIQLLVAATCSGLIFSIVENLLYIYVYNPEGNESFRLWRWTVCTALHTGTSTIAGIGLLRMWRHASAPARNGEEIEFQRPAVVHAYPYIVVAVVIHAAYNGFAMFMSFATDWV